MMAYQRDIVIACDSEGCGNQLRLDAEKFGTDRLIELAAEQQAWVVFLLDGGNCAYCPACVAEVKAELAAAGLLDGE